MDVRRVLSLGCVALAGAACATGNDSEAPALDVPAAPPTAQGMPAAGTGAPAPMPGGIGPTSQPSPGQDGPTTPPPGNATPAPPPSAPAPQDPAPAAGAPAPAPAAGAPAPAPTTLPPGQTLPPVSDYGAPGPFASTTVNNTGPGGDYTMFRPTTLGQDGFKHPIATWGNGITTTPATYPWLGTVASHGIVVIASNSTAVSSQLMNAGLDWLIEQNSQPGDFQGNLDVERAVSIGYSLGGGAALSVASHPNVVTTVSMHPAPGFGAGAHGPVLLFAGSADTVCAPALVQAGYASVPSPAFYAELAGASHLEPVLFAGQELAPTIAWLRLWLYDDQGARDFFYGAGCTLCGSPWTHMTNAAWQ